MPWRRATNLSSTCCKSAKSTPPPSFGAKIRADFIFGMGKVAGKFVIILNIDKVLSVEEIALLTGSDGVANELVVSA